MTLSPLSKLTNHLITSKDELLSFEESDGFDVKELLDWRLYEDFATDFCLFTDAVKKNESITKLRFVLYDDSLKWRAGFWLFNTLSQHLRNAKTLLIGQHPDHFASMADFTLLMRGTERFEKISIEYRGSDWVGRGHQPWFSWDWAREHYMLQCLDVQIDHCEASLVSMASALTSLSHLKTVVFHSNDLTDIDQDIDLSTTDNVEAITGFFQHSSLRSIELTDLAFTDEDVLEAFARSMSGSYIEDLTLNLDGTRSTPLQLERICQGVANCSSLRKVLVRGTFSSLKEVSFPMARLLRSNRKLSSLVLGDFAISKEDVQVLAGVLRDGTCPLTQLCLSSGLPREDFCFLLDGAKTSALLENLHLTHVPVSPDSQMISHLASLHQAPCLRELAVSSVGRREAASADLCKQLVERLSQSFSLEHISCGWVDCDSESKLGTICHLNQYGRRYLLSRSPSKADGVEVLAKHLQRGCWLSDDRYKLDFLYTHLRENPGLCSRDHDDRCTLQEGFSTSPRSNLQGTKRPIQDTTSMIE